MTSKITWKMHYRALDVCLFPVGKPPDVKSPLVGKYSDAGKD